MFLLALGCETPAPRVAVGPAPAVAVASPPSQLEDTCQRSSPDCAAACALRAIDQLEYVDWFDRRCAAVRAGKNADKTVGTEPPPPLPAASPSDGSELFSNPYR
jgi:hypothetical protein